MTGRLAEPRFDATIFVGSPSTYNVAPRANVSARALGRSTKNEPSSPCGRPTRPTTTRSGADFKGRAKREPFLAIHLRRRHSRVLGTAWREVERPERTRLVTARTADAA